MEIVVAVAVAAVLFLLIVPSIRVIGPDQVGLVIKRFSLKKLSADNPIAFRGEAGYQAELLQPGWRFKLWIVFSVQKHPMVQIPAGEIGIVIAQVGRPLDRGAKSGLYKREFGDFSDVRAFVDLGGEKGVQRPALPPGTVAPIHPIGFLVITKDRVYGVPISAELQKEKKLGPETWGLDPKTLEVTVIEPVVRPGQHGREQRIDMVGIVETFEGPPLEPGDIACRLGGFSDVAGMEADGAADMDLVDAILDSKNRLHNNYQDFQGFLDNGGRIGVQHDPLLYGAFNLNPFLVRVKRVPMLVVEQGEVAVIKAYVGLASRDTLGGEFRFGTLVKPGHRGIWREPLHTGKYAINPHCYDHEIVPTCLLTLNWATQHSEAHTLDAHLSPIVAKSREGFVFRIDLQVQIHIPDVHAPRVISAVGTMENLADEVLQAAVGNHFRDKVQSMPAVTFIENRQSVQEEAFHHVSRQLEVYNVTTRGVFIQDVILPEQIVEVLTQREIANQQIRTFEKQQEAETVRIETERQRGTADQQADLARSAVGVTIARNVADARVAEADGEATYVERTGAAKGAEVRAIGLARAEAYLRQVEALGRDNTALVNVVTALSDSKQPFVPEVFVGGPGSSAMDALFGTLTGVLRKGPADALGITGAIESVKRDPARDDGQTET